MTQPPRRLLLASCLLALLTACAGGSSSFSLIGAPVRVYDLTGKMDTILDAEFDFIGRMGAPGRGGEVCCASLPKKWYPGMIATVRWVKDPDTSLLYPTDPDEFRAYIKKEKSDLPTPQRPGGTAALYPHLWCHPGVSAVRSSPRHH